MLNIEVILVSFTHRTYLQELIYKNLFTELIHTKHTHSTMIKLHGVACLYIHVYMKTTTLKLSTKFLTEFQFNQRKYFRGNLGSFDTIYIVFHL